MTQNELNLFELFLFVLDRPVFANSKSGGVLDFNILQIFCHTHCGFFKEILGINTGKRQRNHIHSRLAFSFKFKNLKLFFFI